MNEPNPYTAKDMERYHSGQMTAAERHRLEKAALDDPALADMLEGYAFTNQPIADLQALQQRIAQRVAQESERSRVIFPFRWLKVAAVFLLVVAGGWLAYQSFSGKADTVAASPENSTAKQRNNAPAIQADSVAIATALAPETADSTAPRRDVAIQRRKQTKALPLQPPPITAPLNENAVQKEVRQAEGLTRFTQPPVQEDSTARPMTFKYESVKAGRKAAGDTIKNIDVVMQPLETQMNEVVVTGYGNRKISSAKRRLAAVDTTEPIGGWNSFDNYVMENLRVPDQFDKNSTSQNMVELSFDIDKKGKPVQIKVSSSLCNPCDAEAIRLLEKGPKWKGKKGKVKIKFPDSSKE